MVVAANRDEFFARPAEGFALRDSKTGPILSPLDLEAGGTWVGLSQRGVFAGLTNLRPREAVGGETSPVQPRSNKANETKKLLSRGGVVMSALEAESAKAAMQALMELEEEAYNPFQLVVADGRDGWLIVYRDSPRAIELTEGPHIVGNVEDEWVENGLDEAQASSHEPEVEMGRTPEPACFPGFEGIEGLVDTEGPRALKLMRIRERVEKLMIDPGGDLLEKLAGVCREHVEFKAGEGSPFESTCVHVADRYGTRSSLLMELATETESSQLWTTDGPPCERSFEDRSSLLGSLGVRLSG